MTDSRYTKHPINLRKGDYEKLQQLAETKDTTAAYIVRRAVSRIVDNYEENIAGLQSEIGEIEIKGAIDER